MPPSGLTDQETSVVLRCLEAAVEGPFFPDWEFHALFGLNRTEVAAVVARWPDIDDAEEDVQLAINNSLNNLLGYPHGEPEAFRERVGESWQELRRIFTKWRISRGLSVESGAASESASE